MPASVIYFPFVRLTSCRCASWSTSCRTTVGKRSSRRGCTRRRRTCWWVSWAAALDFFLEGIFGRGQLCMGTGQVCATTGSLLPLLFKHPLRLQWRPPGSQLLASFSRLSLPALAATLCVALQLCSFFDSGLPATHSMPPCVGAGVRNRGTQVPSGGVAGGHGCGGHAWLIRSEFPPHQACAQRCSCGDPPSQFCFSHIRIAIDTS